MKKFWFVVFSLPLVVVCDAQPGAGGAATVSNAAREPAKRPAAGNFKLSAMPFNAQDYVMKCLPKSAVFVSVRNGKVVDQINAGCAFDVACTCVNDDGDKEYQLLDTGKFKKLN